MSRLTARLLLLQLLLPLLLVALHVSGAALVEPPLLRSSAADWAVTLSVQAARYDNGAVAFTGRQYCSHSSSSSDDPGACSFPGPTLSVKAGDTLRLTLLNRLQSDGDGGGPSGAHSSSHPGPNATNLHTHGLHVSPLVDDVFQVVAPGAAHTYVIRVPSDHPPGLHWFHSHVHGHTAMQVMGGMHGALIVEAAEADRIPASYAALRKHTLVLSHVQFAQLKINGSVSQGCRVGARCTPAQGCAVDGPVAPYTMFRSYSFAELSAESGSTLEADARFASGEPVNQYVVNGQLAPTIAMRSGEARVLRVVNTGGAHTLDWQMPRECNMTVLAVDGIFLSAAQSRSVVHMTQAGRWELLVVCAAPGSHVVEAVFGETPRLRQPLLTLEVAKVADDPVAPTAVVTDAELAAIRRPAYMRDLQHATPAFSFAVSFSHLPPSDPGWAVAPCGQWMGMGSDCSAIWRMKAHASSLLTDGDDTANSCPFELFTGSHGGNGSDPWPEGRSYRHVTPSGAVNEARIYGMSMDMDMDMDAMQMDSEDDGGDAVPAPAHDMHGKELSVSRGPARRRLLQDAGGGLHVLDELDTHPFHMHGHHMQIVSYTASDPSDSSWRDYFSIGEWRDTLPTLDGELVVRFTASRHVGENVLHCHVLRHEDRGMMNSFYVCDPNTDGACPPEVMQKLAESNQRAAAGAVAAPSLLLLLTTAAKLALQILFASPF